MLTKRLICQLLNVKNTVIDDYQYFESDESIVFYVHPTKGQQCRCGICGKKSPFYDIPSNINRLWRCMDIGLHRVYLCSDTVRVKCKEHGVRTAAVPWARHNSRFTIDFEHTLAWLSVNCSKEAISKFMRVSWNTVGPVISRVRKELDPHPESRFDNLRCIGIDETSYRKGHTYMTVVVNHDTGNVIWLGDGHDEIVLSEFFKLLTRKQRASIKYVSADGASWIKTCVKKYCPKAKRCLDPFHVVTWANEALSQIRRDAWNEARGKKPVKRKPGRPKKDSQPSMEIAEAIKGSKYALGKNPENLTVNQQAKLELIANTDPRLWEGYQLKEGLRCIFKLDYSAGRSALKEWIKQAEESSTEAFRELGRKIKENHFKAILDTLKYGLSNAMNEAINNKIKLTIRMAYGFRNIPNMFDMIMLRCSDITVPLPWSNEYKYGTLIQR